MSTTFTCGFDGNHSNNRRMTEIMARAEARRTTYHHGDLANALVQAGVELAREGGPEAIVLREAARRVGVSATSAYRHFADHEDLITEVKTLAQQALADAMMAEPVPMHDDTKTQALARLHALGRGYLRFAQAEPGLYRAAFNKDAPSAGTSEPFAMLADALDELVTSGAVAAVRREGAEIPVWAAVHGLAQLLIGSGSLGRLDEARRTAEIEGTLDFITRALVS